MTRAPLVALAAAALIGVSGCAKRAPEMPVVTSLVMPTPPARTLIPVELPEYVEPEPEPVVEAEPPPPPPRPVANVRATEKPAEPPPAPPAPPPVLQPTNTAPSALEQRVLSLLNAAESKLRGVNILQLDPQAKAHFNQARDFMRIARDNLRIRNYVYAELMATKANTVAGLLTSS